MRKFAVLIIFLIFSFAAQANAQDSTNSTPSMQNQLILNGEMIANEISKATGLAISPILGISVLGAYTYYTTPAEQRSEVPWHAKPPFWGPLLVVLLGIILKDSSKIALPKIIIMPLDAIETLLEKNVSAILGLLVVLSSVTGKGIEQLQLAGHDISFSLVSSAYATDAVNSAATTSTGLFELGFLYILVTVVFGLVWVVSQSFNFLIFLCPSSWLDFSTYHVQKLNNCHVIGSLPYSSFSGPDGCAYYHFNLPVSLCQIVQISNLRHHFFIRYFVEEIKKTRD